MVHHLLHEVVVLRREVIPLIANRLMYAVGLLSDLLDASRGLTGTAVGGVHRFHIFGDNFILTLLVAIVGTDVYAILLLTTRVVVTVL